MLATMLNGTLKLIQKVIHFEQCWDFLSRQVDPPRPAHSRNIIEGGGVNTSQNFDPTLGYSSDLQNPQIIQ